MCHGTIFTRLLESQHLSFLFCQMELISLTKDSSSNKQTHYDTMLSLEMQVDNMGEGSFTTHHHIIAIPIEELSASPEAASIKSPETHANGSVQKPEEEGGETQDMGECRYCHEEDFVSKLETPCSCNGTLKYVHRSCIDQWYYTKGSLICEICKQPYWPIYPLMGPPSDDDTEISEEFTISETNTRIQSPLVVAEHASNRLVASMNKDFSLRNPSGGVVFGTALLIFVAVLVIKDAYINAPPKEEKVSHALYCGVVIISVPVYILSWVLQCQAYRKHERERERDRAV